MRTIDDTLREIQSHLQLEAEAEYDVLEEMRGHLEEAVAAARAHGADEGEALRQAAAAFGIEQASAELSAAHAGWGTHEGIAAAALPVIFALVLRWLIFAPDGTAGGWREMLAQPVLLVIAAVAICLPLLRFPRRRYAIALWVFFWGLSLITFLWPTVRW
jgi:hypothetical protein